MHPFAFLLLLIAVLILVSWYKRAPPEARKRVLLWGGGALLLVGLLTGRLNPLVAAFAALIPIVQRVIGAVHLARTLRGLGSVFTGGAGASPGKRSEVRTRFLRMRLDHASGDMDGEVLEGTLRGRRLSELGLEELRELYRRCVAEDRQSALLLEAYLDRMHGAAWREGVDTSGSAPAGSDGPMSEHEARQILGIGPEAGRQEIIAAHRRLMQKLHPDRGGSTYLAAKINQAKALLLGE